MGKVARKVRRACNGDQRAIHWLYRRHVDAAWQLAYRILQRSDLAQDCTQDAFVKAFAGLDSLKDPDRFSGWIIRIVYRRGLDMLRRERRHQAEELTPVDGAEHPQGDFLLRRRLMEAIDSLDENLQMVFIRYYLMGEKHAEIARSLGIATGSSKRRLHEARRAMRSLLEDVSPR